ncbi:MAG: hypothetical protein IAE99_12705 [Rhodothermales bacterium]|nr:hypothetical protein [Rhodothermales bacterium]
MAIVAKQPIRQSAGAATEKSRATAPRGKRPARAQAPKRTPSGKTARVSSGRLPGWGDLGMTPMAIRVSRMEALSARLPAQRFYLVLLVMLLGVVGYVGHVYATKQLYRSLQTARSQNLALHLKHNRLRGELDAATAPSVVVSRALALGLEEGMVYGPTVPMGTGN